MQMQEVDTIVEMEQELGRISELLGGDEARELLELFFEDSTPRLELLSQAVESTDPQTAKQEALTLKGSTGILGASSLWRLCLGLEQELGRGDWTGARQELTVLRSRLGAVQEYFSMPGRRVA